MTAGLDAWTPRHSKRFQRFADRRKLRSFPRPPSESGLRVFTGSHMILPRISPHIDSANLDGPISFGRARRGERAAAASLPRLASSTTNAARRSPAIRPMWVDKDAHIGTAFVRRGKRTKLQNRPRGRNKTKYCLIDEDLTNYSVGRGFFGRLPIRPLAAAPSRRCASPGSWSATRRVWPALPSAA